MGSNNLDSAVSGATIPPEHHNSVKEALASNQVPRNTSGVATDLAGSLGEDSLRFLFAKIASGYFFAGQMLPSMNYNNAVGPGHGWMKCDGRIVSEANYNTEHGAGLWDTYILSSPLDGLYLPDMSSNRFLTGATATAQDGTAPLTRVGNASNQVSLQHSHTVDSHGHRYYWYDGTNGGGYNSSGTAIATTETAGAGTDHGIVTKATVPNYILNGSRYTDKQTPGTDNQLSTTQSIKPDAFEAIYYMRII